MHCSLVKGKIDQLRRDLVHGNLCISWQASDSFNQNSFSALKELEALSPFRNMKIEQPRAYGVSPRKATMQVQSQL